MVSASLPPKVHRQAENLTGLVFFVFFYLPFHLMFSAHTLTKRHKERDALLLYSSVLSPVSPNHSLLHETPKLCRALLHIHTLNLHYFQTQVTSRISAWENRTAQRQV